MALAHDDEIEALEKKIQELKTRQDVLIAYITKELSSPGAIMDQIAPSVTSIVDRSQERNYKLPVRNTYTNDLTEAYVTRTDDPLKMGRVQIWIPRNHDKINLETLPWARVMRPFGSFEDSGFVAPLSVNSLVYVQFLRGQSDEPIVLGCVPLPKRGENYTELPEEIMMCRGSIPGIRADGKNLKTNNDVGHTMPPWNNESYNGIDTDIKNSGVPHISGWKTPEKHMLQFVDGPPTNAHIGKRVVLQSSRGNCIFMKDDAIQPSANIFQNPFFDDFRDGYVGGIYKIAPLNGKTIELEKTGLQLQTFGGARLILSDANDSNAIEDNLWTTAFAPKRLKSFTCLESITNHQMFMLDHESSEGIRSKHDGITLVGATGSHINICCHSENNGKAGENHGILLKSITGHTIELSDKGADIGAFAPRTNIAGLKFNKGQGSPGIAVAGSVQSQNAFLKISSGWGQSIEFNDSGSQSEESDQYITIANRSDNNIVNFINMQCSAKHNKDFTIHGAGNLYTVAKQNIMSIADGVNYVSSSKSDIMLSAMSGNLYASVLKTLLIYTKEGNIYLATGPVNEETQKYERSCAQVITAHSCVECPLTGIPHYTGKAQHTFVVDEFEDPKEDNSGENKQ